MDRIHDLKEMSVPDLDAAIAWWHDVLDFDIERQSAEDCARLSHA